MRAYLITTGIIFAAMAALHVFVVVRHRHVLATDPWPAVVLVISIALTIWAVSLIRRVGRSS